MRKCVLFKLLTAALVLPLSLWAQSSATDTSKSAASRSPLQRSAAGPRPYSEVIPAKAKTSAGLFKVHQVDENYFIEIPDSLIGRDFLQVSRISKAPAGARLNMQGYAGDQIGDQVLRFEKGPGNKLFLKTISYGERSNDTTETGMYRSVLNSNVQPIVAAFDMKAIAKDSVSGATGTVIDITTFIGGDNEVLFFDSKTKKDYGLTTLYADRSYIERVNTFPTNVEIRTVKTYMRNVTVNVPGLGSLPISSGPATFELNSSLVLLPKVPMKPRGYDARVGYFAANYSDFDANPQGVKNISMITRWRLEPKPADVERYLRGELVEPQKPIVFYIDPATPKKWVPYLIQGVNDWNVAFEKAGWKNAIVAKEAPTNDPNWSLEDARHSAIVYKPSTIANAMGPHMHDPRSGEILESHISWYHNVMNLLRNWYFIQASPLDPRARKMQLDDELMGQLIRFVSSHEVGHTLGLRHNYGASSTVPVEKLRDKAWVEANGHTPSIMDYARFNYVAQPEDGITEKGIFPRIGEYDKWAIEWGYRWMPEFKTPEEERTYMNQWIIKSVNKNNRLLFGTEQDPNDPRFQNEDLGDDAMKASAYGIKNLKRIIPNLTEWTKVANEDHNNAGGMYREVVNQFTRYVGHVIKNIGGITTTPKAIEEDGAVTAFVPKAKQKEAMAFLQQQVIATPTWLIDKQLATLTTVDYVNSIATVQQAVINNLISDRTFWKLLQFEAQEGSKAYSVTELLTDLRKGIWKELYSRQSIDMYRRNQQKMHAERLIAFIQPPPATQAASGVRAPVIGPKTSDMQSIVKGQIRTLVAEIRVALPATKDTTTRLHLQDVLERLDDALKKDKV
jgi:hypothetical protein